MSEKKPQNENENTKPPPVKTEKDYARVCPTKLSKRELEELYFALVDNNTELKKSLNQQLDKIRQLNTKVARLANIQKSSIAKDGSGRNPCCATTRAAMAEQNISILELKKANERMAERIRILNMRLCSARQFLKKASPQPSIQYRCPKCNSGHAVKDAAVSPSKMTSNKTDGIDVAVQETPEFRDVETDMSDSEHWMTKCKEECKTMMGNLQDKISTLEEELSTTHKDYSSRISRLEQLLERLQGETMAARAQRAASENDLADKLAQARALQCEIATQLSMEKKKVAELETQLKSAQLSNEVAKTIETHLSNEVLRSRSTHKEAAVNTQSNGPESQNPPYVPNKEGVLNTQSNGPESQNPPYVPKKEVAANTQNNASDPQNDCCIPNKGVAVNTETNEPMLRKSSYILGKKVGVNSQSNDPETQYPRYIIDKDIVLNTPTSASVTQTLCCIPHKEVAVNTQTNEHVPQIPFFIHNKEAAVNTKTSTPNNDPERRRNTGWYSNDMLESRSSSKEAIVNKTTSYESVVPKISRGAADADAGTNTHVPSKAGNKTTAYIEEPKTPTPNVHREYEEAGYLQDGRYISRGPSPVRLSTDAPKKDFIEKLRHSVSKIKRSICTSPEHRRKSDQNPNKTYKQVCINAQPVNKISEDTSTVEETVTKSYEWESMSLRYKPPDKGPNKTLSRQGSEAPYTPYNSATSGVEIDEQDEVLQKLVSYKTPPVVDSACCSKDVEHEQPCCHEPTYHYRGSVRIDPRPESTETELPETSGRYEPYENVCCSNKDEKAGWKDAELISMHGTISDQPISKPDSRTKPNASFEYVPEQYEKIPLLSSQQITNKDVPSNRSSIQEEFPSTLQLELKAKLHRPSTDIAPEQFEKLYSCIKNMEKQQNEAAMRSSETQDHARSSQQIAGSNHAESAEQRLIRVEAQAHRRRDNDDSGIADKSIEAHDDLSQTLAERTNRELQKQIDDLQKQLDELKKSTLKDAKPDRTSQDSERSRRKKSLDLQSFDVEIMQVDVPVLRNFNDCKYYVVDPEKSVVVEVEQSRMEKLTKSVSELIGQGRDDFVEHTDEAPTSSKNIQSIAPKFQSQQHRQIVPESPCDRTSSEIPDTKNPLVDRKLPYFGGRQDSDDARITMSVFDSKRKIDSVLTDRVSSTARDSVVGKDSEVGPKASFMTREMYDEARGQEDVEMCSHATSVCRCPRAALRQLTMFRSCSGTLRFTTSSPMGLRACDKCQPSDTGTQPEPECKTKGDPVSEAGTYTIEGPPVSSRSEGTNPDNTHYDVSSIADSHPKSLSPEDKWTSTQTNTEVQTLSHETAYLSEGEVPKSDGEHKFSVGEKPLRKLNTENKQDNAGREETSSKMESALQAINQELVRCRRLLQSKREETEPLVERRHETDPPDRQLELRKVSGARELNNSPPQKCVFTLHIGTIVLSDEAVMKTRSKNLMLTWKFYEQSPAMTRMHCGRVVNFNFSTEYDVKVSDQFLRYLKHEELRIQICEVDKPNRPFARAALPLRDPLLNLNRRVDMSLALMATEWAEGESRPSRAGEDGDELGVLDLWCTLRAEPWILSTSKKSTLPGQSDPLLPSAAAEAPATERRQHGSILLMEDRASSRLDQDLDLRWSKSPIYEMNKKPDKTTDDVSSFTIGFWDATPEMSQIPQASEEKRALHQPRAGTDFYRPAPSIPTNKIINCETYPEGLKGRPQKKRDSEEDQAFDFGIEAVPACAPRSTNQRRLRATSSNTNQSVFDMLRHDKWMRMNYETPERDGSRGCTYEANVEQKAERDDHETELYDTNKNNPNVSLKTSEFKRVTIGPNTYSPLDGLTEPSFEFEEISITVMWLALNEESSAMLDRTVRRLYVAYSFLGHSGAELETPVSLPKPKHQADKCYFDFKKSFLIGPAQLPLLAQMSRQHSGGHKPDPLDCVIFSVVSEPMEDPLGLANCVDVGYAYLYLGNLLSYCAGDSYTEVLRVHEAHAAGGSSGAVCGVLAVRLDGLDVVRRAAARQLSV